MRPVASLRLELAASGRTFAIAGLGGLAAAAAAGVDPGRAAIAFLVPGIVLGLIQHFVGTRWIRVAAGGAPKAPGGTEVEPSGTTLRRVVLLQGGAMVVLLILLWALRPSFGATFGGVLAGVGLANLFAGVWVMRREQETGRGLYRETGGSPFSGGRRSIYTLPRKADTLAT